MTLKSYIRTIWANNLKHIISFMNEDAIFLPFLLILLSASYTATNQNLIGLKIVPCIKIAWKIQIWSQICHIRCIASSNLTFLMILEHFFSFFKHIWQLFLMNPQLAKRHHPLQLTNFLCSFTWWGLGFARAEPGLVRARVFGGLGL